MGHTPPEFINEEKVIANILHWFMKQIQNQAFSVRKNALTFSLKKNKRLCHALFLYGDEAEYLWSCLQRLSEKDKLFSIKLAKNSHTLDVVYENARLIFNPEKEDLLRDWLKCPFISPEIKRWNQLVESNKANFDDQGHSLLDNPIKAPGWTAEEIINGLVCIATKLQTPKTLRKLSSQCFLGDSKFLDQRKTLLETIYPSLKHNHIERPVLLNCFIPEQFQEVLFIENQDTFIEQVKIRPQNQVLIYSAGFRATDKFVRSTGGAIFSMLENQYSIDTLILFKNWWFKHSNTDIPCYFWGDLDYSGMSILKQLKNQFPNLTAWKPGYEPLLNRLESGHCHTPEQSKKIRQINPEKTGCAYCDEVLLPAIQANHCFVDQEAI